MRNRIVISMVAVSSVLCLSLALALDSRAGAQAQVPEGWNPCPRCQNNDDRTEARLRNNVDEITDYDRRDFSGVWGYNGVNNSLLNAPPFTEYGQELYEATRGEEFTSDGLPLYSRGSEKDYGLLACDPLGWPRMFDYNYGFEFVMLPDRVIQFFELEHTWRTIWTDGRDLPEDPPVLNWLGWSIGHWEGDTFVIESSGFDERSWIDRTSAQGNQPGGGLPHSNQMRVVERWTRVEYGTIEAQVTIHDPLVYTEPFVGETGLIGLVPDTEIWENMCVASEMAPFNENADSL